MSATINPDIVTDGLVLCLDAANSDCFRGEPTTNKINGLYSTSFANSGFTITNNYATNFDGSNTASLLLSGSWIARTAGYSSGFVSGNTYTTTWILKNVDMNTLSLGWGGVHTGTRVNVSINLTNGTASSASGSNLYGIYSLGDGWYAIWYVTTLSGTAHYPQLSASTTGKYILYGGMQVEEKNYPTPIVNGTRGGTVATGGGLFDLSNNNNHGTIVRNAVPTASFYNSGNRGNLIFDGVNDYVALNNKDGLGDNFSSFSIDLVIRTRTGTGANEVGYILHRSTSYTVGTAVYSIYMATDSLGFSVNGSNFLILNNKNNVLAHYCYTWDGSVTKLYTNGVFTTSVNFTTFTNIRTGSTATIGSTSISPGYRPANCDLFNLKIYDEALTPKQILDNYRATKGRYGL